MVSDCFLGSRQETIVSRIDCDVGGVGGPLEARKLRSPAFSLGLGAIRLARLPASARVADRAEQNPVERAGRGHVKGCSREETSLETAPGSPGSSAGRLVVILVVILVVKRHDVDAKLTVRLQKPLQLRVAYPSLDGLVFFPSLGEIMRFLHQGRQLVRR